MDKYTKLELTVLRNIRLSEYIDVIEPDQLVNYPTWSFAVTDGYENNGFTPNQIKGAMGSCVKKGLIGCQQDPGDDECCWLTEEGVKILVENNLF